MACVLVVEDEPEIREFMEVMFGFEGYETMGAPNGQVALELMRERKPSIVLLDMMMPVMDGWTFRQHQLAESALADVPVIGVTAMYDPQQVAQRLKIPCFGKPLNTTALLEQVRTVCGASGTRGH